jgi:NADH:ubiquinone oxidoreductase subunit 5 (subunit L)/multisubunit Na+/H+ antiporter MnhA subunit/multisubunit Na+/H+ antiporter MnhB subunit
MNPIWLLTTAILAPAACGAFTLTLPRRDLVQRVGLAILGPVLSLLLLGVFVAKHGTDAGVFFRAWMPQLQLNLQLNADRLGLFFAFLVAGVGLLITLYARAYFGPDRDALYRFFPSLHLFMTAMLGIVLADNFVLLLLFWEMTSVSSFLLIGWERDDPAAVKKAMQAFVVTGMGGLTLMTGLILLGQHTGQWTFSGLFGSPLQNDATTRWAFVLIFAGAAAKSAQFPLHFWLPGAMVAPTPVSAYLHSATMVKAGVYLVGRLWPYFATILPIWPKLIIGLGALTMVYGAFVALQKTDLKQIFAYTTVSQLGLLMCMYGLAAFTHEGQPNLIWDVTQVLNHALYKAPLFILAGAIGHVASRQLPQLRGFFWRDRTSWIMATVLLLAAYGLAAGPGTLSFVAKEFFFYQVYHGFEASRHPAFYLLIAASIATGMFNVAIFIRLATTLLARLPAAPSESDREPKDDGQATVDAHPTADVHPHPAAADAEHAAAHLTAHPVGHDASSGGGGHGHAHETGFWPIFLWLPGALVVAFQFLGGLAPGVLDRFVLQHLEPSRYYERHLPSFVDILGHLSHPQLPLIMSGLAISLGLVLGFLPLLRRGYDDPLDHAYPGFYNLVTRGGGRVFGSLQTGHAAWYVALVWLAFVGMFAWSVGFDFDGLLRQWPTEARFELERPGEFGQGLLLTFLVCLTAILLTVVKDRASRVLVLGACGFSVTAVYYLYRAPDLALTQISIEIVSLVLFLLVLSLLPSEAPKPRVWVMPRIAIAVAVGAMMFWLTLTSSVGPQPSGAFRNRHGQPIANLGEFFMRNSYEGVDTTAVPLNRWGGGFVNRAAPDQRDTKLDLHHGAGGDNVVNVVLVDLRGFDTMGEITVLGLAAMGVWTILRRRRGFKSPKERVEEEEARLAGKRFLRLDIPEPTGEPDSRHQLRFPAVGQVGEP